MTRLQLTALFGLSLGAVACTTDGGPSMIIKAVAAPDDECMFSPDTTDYVSGGYMDVESGRTFSMVPILVSAIDSDPNSTTRRYIYIEAAQVSLIPAPTERSAAVITSIGDKANRTVLVSGSLEPNFGGGQSSITMPFTAIDSEQGEALASSPAYEDGVQVVVEFSFSGSIDGNSVESRPFHFPVTLCTDCVLDFGDCQPPEDPTMPITDIKDCIPMNPEARYVASTTCLGDQTP